MDAPGQYNVTLQFAEANYSEPGYRQFQVNMEGADVTGMIDLAAIAGRHYAWQTTVGVTVTDDELTIELESITRSPVISGILVKEAE